MEPLQGAGGKNENPDFRQLYPFAGLISLDGKYSPSND
jgi:hypothetical protein